MNLSLSGNELSFGNIIPWDQVTPSQYYKFFLRGIQSTGSGVPVDSSGQGNHATLGSATDAEVWGTNVGWMSSVVDAAATQQGATLASSIVGYNFNAASPLTSIFAMRFAGTIATSTGVVGAQNSAAAKGWRIGANAGNDLTVGIGDGTTYDATEAGKTWIDAWDGTERHVVVVLDGLTKICHIYANGVLLSSADFSTCVGDSTAIVNWGFGHTGSTSNGNTLAGKYRDAHLLIVPGGIPANMAAIAKLFYSRSFVPLKDSEIDLG